MYNIDIMKITSLMDVHCDAETYAHLD